MLGMIRGFMAGSDDVGLRNVTSQNRDVEHPDSLESAEKQVLRFALNGTSYERGLDRAAVAQFALEDQGVGVAEVVAGDAAYFGEAEALVEAEGAPVVDGYLEAQGLQVELAGLVGHPVHEQGADAAAAGLGRDIDGDDVKDGLAAGAQGSGDGKAEQGAVGDGGCRPVFEQHRKGAGMGEEGGKLLAGVRDARRKTALVEGEKAIEILFQPTLVRIPNPETHALLYWAPPAGVTGLPGVGSGSTTTPS